MCEGICVGRDGPCITNIITFEWSHGIYASSPIFSCYLVDTFFFFLEGFNIQQQLSLTSICFFISRFTTASSTDVCYGGIDFDIQLNVVHNNKQIGENSRSFEQWALWWW